MNIFSTQYTLKYKAFEIYLSGCDGLCDGCHNHELFDYSIGKDYKSRINSIIKKISEFDSLIENVWILGGEPLLQDYNELLELLKQINKTQKHVWLWTRFEIQDIPFEIKEQCHYIKTGKFIPQLATENNIYYNVKLATSNQKIIKMEESHERKNILR